MRAILTLTLLAVAAIAEAATVYRCRDAAGHVLYADVPCTNAVVVELPESRADPRAIERLQRDVAAFHERQALRDAAARGERERARREADAEAARRAEAAQRAAQEATWYVPGYWWYPPLPVVKPPRPAPRRPARTVERPYLVVR
jgi:hypothetical protein